MAGKRVSLCDYLWWGAIVLTLLPGCRQNTPGGAGEEGSRPGRPAPKPAAQGQAIEIKGSDTMVNLGQAWAEAFMEKNPGESVSVTGGGSGTGIVALINGTCAIAQSSRDMSQKEIDQAKGRNIEPHKIVVGMDGLAIAVSADNPIKSLTLEQLRKIYNGQISDWQQVGGKAGKMVVLSRESNSGTFVYFKEHVLKDENYRSDALLLPSTKSIVQELSNSGNGIGYGGEAYFRNQAKVKIVSVSEKSGAPAIAPTDENVMSGRYPISRPLNLYTAGKPKGTVARFINFVLSPDGQKIVKEIGFVPLKGGGE